VSSQTLRYDLILLIPCCALVLSFLYAFSSATFDQDLRLDSVNSVPKEKTALNSSVTRCFFDGHSTLSRSPISKLFLPPFPPTVREAGWRRKVTFLDGYVCALGDPFKLRHYVCY